ncbi:ABC transporter ATP-binding protein [uncultured Thiohalocapsa sp.]|uniref:ABC transporter ATP-binding protein n=1 Tax=uncultured Thiohalocapsa sp. TaxID=768990 RepID=UPI0025D8D6F6|nr:ABC transporter ATP-binding protein [uncultured Thiohalocapsa sp.]
MTQADGLSQAPSGYRWSHLLAMAAAHKRELLLANAIAVLATLAAVPVPLLMPVLVDEVLLEQPGAAVAFMNGLFPAAWHGPVLYVLAVLTASIGLRALAVGLAVVQSRQFTIISKDIVFRIRSALLGRLQRVSMAEYETLGSGTVASHLVTDVDAVDELIGSAVAKLIVAVLSILGTAVVLLWMHWQLGLFILLLNPLVIYVTLVFGRRVKEMKRRENAAYEAFTQSLTETLDAVQQIRAGNRERYFIGRGIDTADAIRRWSCAFTWKSDAANRLSFTVFLFGFDLFRAVSMLMVLFSDLTIGEMLAVFAYLWFMMGPVQEVLNVQYAFQAADAALKRINRLLALHREPDWPHAENPFAGKRAVAVAVSDLTFAYGDGPRVLNGISFQIAAGEKVAIVGASGGGKTTLVQVLLGLYAPSGGRVCFDGVPVQRIGMDVVRDNVATVLQHPALFNDSLRLNLTLGRDVPDARLWEALRVAQLADVAADLPQGLDTLLGRNGVRLSGGQRQRLAVARMVLADPKVVILDEATSALDTTTEARLHAALARFLAGRTTLIIAHRLSAVRQADRALVLEHGRIVEEGSHAELIDEDGAYAALYARQVV